MVANIYLIPTPVLQDGSGGQFTGYIAPNVLVDQNGVPILDDKGNYILTN